MNDEELDKLLRAADPARDVVVPTFHSNRGQVILAAAIGAPRRRYRNRLIVAVVVTFALISTAAAAVYVLWPRSASDPTSVSCFAEADPQSQQIWTSGSGDSLTGPCDSLWLNGAYGIGRTVPPLVACVINDSIVGVFPTDDAQFCQANGLPPALTSAGADEEIDMADRLHMVGAECVLLVDAVSTAEQILDDMAITDWTIIATNVDVATRPCTSYALDFDTRTVTVVPIPEPPE